MSENICRTWLPCLNADIPAGIKSPADLAAFDLALGCARLGGLMPGLRPDAALSEGYYIFTEGGKPVIAGGGTGILYGAYAYLEARATGDDRPEGRPQPF